MSCFKLRIEHHYLHFTLSRSTLNFEETKDLLVDIKRSCDDHVCRRVLLEKYDVKSEMTALDAYELGNYLSEVGFQGHWLAIVIDQARNGILEDFFETVAFNRGHKVQFFSSRREAIDWLAPSEGKEVRVGAGERVFPR